MTFEIKYDIKYEDAKFSVYDGKMKCDSWTTLAEAKHSVVQWKARDALTSEVSRLTDRLVTKYSPILTEEEIRKIMESEVK